MPPIDQRCVLSEGHRGPCVFDNYPKGPSTTPRTDDAERTSDSEGEIVNSDFARQLEDELNEANEEIRRLQKIIDSVKISLQ